MAELSLEFQSGNSLAHCFVTSCAIPVKARWLLDLCFCNHLLLWAQSSSGVGGGLILENDGTKILNNYCFVWQVLRSTVGIMLRNVTRYAKLTMAYLLWSVWSTVMVLLWLVVVVLHSNKIWPNPIKAYWKRWNKKCPWQKARRKTWVQPEGESLRWSREAVLSEEPVASCWEQACRTNAKESCWEQPWRVNEVKTRRERSCPRQSRQKPQLLQQVDTLATADSREMREWVAAEELKQVTAISSGPACRCREAPGAPDRKENRQKQNGWANRDTCPPCFAECKAS